MDIATIAMQNEVGGSIVVSISACHADDPGSIPGRGVYLHPGAFPTDVLTNPCVGAHRWPRWSCFSVI